MPAPTSTLGTLLRHLTELLDGAVEQAYRDAGLRYRPRYTPVVRALLALGPASIRAISLQAGITHSAVSQTVAQMVKDRLVKLHAGEDARERIAALTPLARRMLPALERQWDATGSASYELESELSAPLSAVIGEALDALARRPFSERIAHAALTSTTSKPRKT